MLFFYKNCSETLFSNFLFTIQEKLVPSILYSLLYLRVDMDLQEYKTFMEQTVNSIFLCLLHLAYFNPSNGHVMKLTVCVYI